MLRRTFPTDPPCAPRQALPWLSIPGGYHAESQSMSIHQFHARHDPHRPRSSWHHLLDVANDEGEVLARLREFFSSFTPYEIESMPAPLRPGKLMGPRDVTDYAFELVTYQLDHGDGLDLVAAFTDVLGHAASRLSLLSGRSREGDQETA